MLTRSRPARLHPDAALPGRDVLLDADAVAERLGRVLGIDGGRPITACVPQRVKYRIGESLRVTYRLTVAGGTHLVTARGFPAGSASARRAFERAAAHAAVVGDALRPVALDQPLDAVWWTFPSDRRLRGVEPVAAAAPEVAALLGPAATWSRSETIALAAERSVTFRAEDPAGAAVGFAKLYAADQAWVCGLAARYDTVAASLARGGLPVGSPRPLACDPERRLLVLEAMPGVRWIDVDPGTMPSALHRLGVAIAAVHRVAPPPGTAVFGRLAASRLARSAELVGAARPDVADRVHALAARLAGSRPVDDDVVLLHGDCHPGNALVTSTTTSVIDLDQAGVGPSAADLGSVVARLIHGAVVGERDAHATAALVVALLVGYASVRPLPRTLAWSSAAALLAERAIRAVNRVDRHALEHLDAVLVAADEVLRAGVPR